MTKSINNPSSTSTSSSTSSFINLNLLNEANQIEHLFKSLVTKRIHQFENWLILKSQEIEKEIENNNNEKNSNSIPIFVIFGHAQYFKYLLNQTKEMRNCDIWKVTALINENNQITWNNLDLLHRTPYSYHHPIQVFKEFWFPSQYNSQNESQNEPQNHSESEIICRICQLTKEESNERLIKPCLCSGTISFVHVSCLNQWRRVSLHSFYQCNICHYSYNIQRTFLSQLLLHKNTFYIIIIILFLIIFIIFGLLTLLINYSLQINLLNYPIFKKISYQNIFFQQCFNNSYYNLIVCNSFIEFLYSGLLISSFLSILIYFLYSLYYVCNLFFNNYNLFLERRHTYLLHCIWLYSIFQHANSQNPIDNRHMTLFLALGVVNIYYNLYEIVGKYLKDIIQNLGEIILEPNQRT